MFEMKNVVDTSEVLGTVETPGGRCELCASAVGTFDEAANRMAVKLGAFLRPADLLTKERHFRADWLPEDETVTESVAREDCHELGREIFHRWVKKVREAAPQLHRV